MKIKKYQFAGNIDYFPRPVIPGTSYENSDTTSQQLRNSGEDLQTILNRLNASAEKERVEQQRILLQALARQYSLQIGPLTRTDAQIRRDYIRNYGTANPETAMRAEQDRLAVRLAEEHPLQTALMTASLLTPGATTATIAGELIGNALTLMATKGKYTTWSDMAQNEWNLSSFWSYASNPFIYIYPTRFGINSAKKVPAGVKYLRNGYNNGELFGYQRYFEPTGKVDANGVELTRTVWRRPAEGTPYTRSSSGQVTTQFTLYSAPRLPQQGFKLETPTLRETSHSTINFDESPRPSSLDITFDASSLLPKNNISDISKFSSLFIDYIKLLGLLVKLASHILGDVHSGYVSPIRGNGKANYAFLIVDPKSIKYYEDVIVPMLKQNNLNVQNPSHNRLGTATPFLAKEEGVAGLHLSDSLRSYINIKYPKEAHSTMTHESISHLTDKDIPLSSFGYSRLLWEPDWRLNKKYPNIAWFRDVDDNIIILDRTTKEEYMFHPEEKASLKDSEVRATMNETRLDAYEGVIPESDYGVEINGKLYSPVALRRIFTSKNLYGKDYEDFNNWLEDLFMNAKSQDIRNFVRDYHKSSSDGFSKIFGLPVVGGAVIGATQKDKQGGKIKYFK